MQKLLILLLASVLVLMPTLAAAEGDAVAEQQVVAEEEQAVPEQQQSEPEQGQEEPADDLDKVLTPDSPFYFLKRFVESVRLFLTFDEEKKGELLAQLVEERARELEALQQKYADGELTEEQLALLEKALDGLVMFTERLIEHISEMNGIEDEDQAGHPGYQDKDEEEGEDSGDAQDGKDEDEDESDGEKGIGEHQDKFLARIQHLEAIAQRVPEQAQKGLNRAIANAWRQRERMVAMGKLAADPETEQPEEDPVEEEAGAETSTAENSNGDTTATNSDSKNTNDKQVGPPPGKGWNRADHPGDGPDKGNGNN